MFILFIIFSFFSFIINVRGEIQKIKRYFDFEKMIKNYENILIYAYDSSIVNSKNEKIFENHNKILNFLSQINQEKEELGFCNINLFMLDFSEVENSKFISFYNPNKIGEFLFFYREAIQNRILVDMNIVKGDIINNIYENFEKRETLKSRRWRRSKKQILFRESEDKCNCSCNKTYISSDIGCYSAPRVGISFGWGLPFCNWPGYWYGRGPCNFFGGGFCGAPAYFGAGLNFCL
jgi:hypothetical protein